VPPGIGAALCADIALAFLTLRLARDTRRSTLDSPSYNLWHTAWHFLIVAGQALLLVAAAANEEEGRRRHSSSS